MDQGTSETASAPIGHPGTGQASRFIDREIIRRLAEARKLRPTNPVFKRGRMIFDFKTGRVRVAHAPRPAY